MTTAAMRAKLAPAVAKQKIQKYHQKSAEFISVFS
jgi:hypothetical protein